MQWFQNNDEEFEKLKIALAEATDVKEPVLDEEPIEVENVSETEKAPVKKPFKKPNVEVLYNTKISEIQGDGNK